MTVLLILTVRKEQEAQNKLKKKDDEFNSEKQKNEVFSNF